MAVVESARPRQDRGVWLELIAEGVREKDDHCSALEFCRSFVAVVIAIELRLNPSTVARVRVRMMMMMRRRRT
jgi:hypothetical protein